MTFYLGKRSKAELEGVHPLVVSCVHDAIAVSVVDFSVHDGIRDIKTQQEYVDRGVSKTLNSQHIKQEETGYGHAVDLVPYINGKLRWEMNPLYDIAEAMRWAAEKNNVHLRWGGCWSRLREILPGRESMELAVEGYIKRRQSQGRRPFVDGPHFELLEW